MHKQISPMAKLGYHFIESWAIALGRELTMSWLVDYVGARLDCNMVMNPNPWRKS